MTTELDFEEWGTITIHEDIVPGQVIQFHPSKYNYHPKIKAMHEALVKWGEENGHDIGICIKSAKGWPVPCAIVFPKEDLK